MLARVCVLALGLISPLVLASARPAGAFRLVFWQTADDVQTSLQLSPRWPIVSFPQPGEAIIGVSDGLVVSVHPSLAPALGVDTPQEMADYEAAVRGAFAAWESPVLRFRVFFGLPPGLFAEINVGAVTQPLETYFGITGLTYGAGPFELTNGTRAGGVYIRSAVIGLNLATILPLSEQLTPEQRKLALQRLLMHEIGHALGLDHPQPHLVFPFSGPHLDTNVDPLDLLLIDPHAPFAGLAPTSVYDLDAIMSNQPSQLALFYTALRNDDRAGRDVLYPLPPDDDADGASDFVDNCLGLYNMDQRDTGGLLTTSPNGRGDACECGAVGPDGRIDAGRAVELRQALAGAQLAKPGNCNVYGPGSPLYPSGGILPEDCDVVDWVVLERRLQGLDPPLGTDCQDYDGLFWPADLTAGYGALPPRWLAALMLPDGRALIAFQDRDLYHAWLARCDGLSCYWGFEVDWLDAAPGAGERVGIAPGPGGLPVIGYGYTASVAAPVVLQRCLDDACKARGPLRTLAATGRWPAFAVAADDRALAVYESGTGGALRLARCADAACASVSSDLEIAPGGGWAPSLPALAIGADGLPLVAYFDSANGAVRAIHCADLDCSSRTSQPIDAAPSVYGAVSLAIGADELPIVVYSHYWSGQLRFVRCNDASCSSAAPPVPVGWGTELYAAIAVDLEGRPLIPHFGTGSTPQVLRCGNASCTAGNRDFDLVGESFPGFHAAAAVSPTGAPGVAFGDFYTGRLLFGR